MLLYKHILRKDSRDPVCLETGLKNEKREEEAGEKREIVKQAETEKHIAVYIP